MNLQEIKTANPYLSHLDELFQRFAECSTRQQMNTVVRLLRKEIDLGHRSHLHEGSIEALRKAWIDAHDGRVVMRTAEQMRADRIRYTGAKDSKGRRIARKWGR